MNVRTAERNQLIYHLRVFDSTNGHLLGHMTDINSEGMMLVSEQAIELGKRYGLRMDLPSNFPDNKQLNFIADSRWCRRENNLEYYSIGFLFVEIDDANLANLEKLIQDFIQKDISIKQVLDKSGIY